MVGQASDSPIPMQLAQGCIVVSIQVDLSDEILARFRSDLLNLLQSSGANAVILDVSGIAIMDLEEFEALRDTMSMAGLMGARTIFSGFQAGVVSALVELEAHTDDISAAFNLDAAFAMLADDSDDDESAPPEENLKGAPEEHVVEDG